MNTGVVIAVSRSDAHTMSKPNHDSIKLLAGFGVEGDVHAGETVQHQSRATQEASQPNLRQVHLIHSELHAELKADGFDVAPGQMGENITTRGIDLLGLPAGARLKIGEEAEIEVTGLRSPCSQLDGIYKGLMKATLGRDEAGRLVRKSGIMSIVRHGGVVRPGDEIRIELPAGSHVPLEPV
jgi:hypothetical protein